MHYYKRFKGEFIMSIATEISRLQTARNTIRNTLVGWGAALSTDTLDALATKLGEVSNQGAVDAEVKEGETYTIPKGYHSGSGTVKGVAGGGRYNLQTKTVTPTKAQQNVTPDSGYYGMSGVTVEPIPAAYQDVSSVTAAAGDVLANKVFIDAEGNTVAGTMPNNGDVSATIDGLTDMSATIPAGYTSGGTVALDNSIETALAAI